MEQIPLPRVTIPQVKAERPLPCSDPQECSVQPTQPQDQSNPSPNQVTPSENGGGKSSSDAGNSQKSGAKSDKGKSKKQPAAAGQSKRLNHTFLVINFLLVIILVHRFNCICSG